MNTMKVNQQRQKIKNENFKKKYMKTIEKTNIIKHKQLTHRHTHTCNMFDVEALKRLQDDLWVEEWRRVRQVHTWCVYADCRERERHGYYGWRKSLVIWTGALKERRSERMERRKWFKKMSAAQVARAEYKWHTLADRNLSREFLESAIRDRVMEQQAYGVVEVALARYVPPELVRVVWTMMEMDDAWGQLDPLARMFLWRFAAEVEAELGEKVQAPWRLSWQRDSARRKWTRLVFELRKGRFSAHDGRFWQGQTFGWWDVLSPWRAGWHPWRVSNGH